MIQDQALEILTAQRQELIKELDKAENDQEKTLRLGEHLESVNVAIEKRKQDLLQTKNMSDHVETKVEEELNIANPNSEKEIKKNLRTEYKNACNEYKSLVSQIADSRLKKKDLRVLLGYSK